MEEKEWNDLFNKLEQVTENLEKVRGLKMEELDELCMAVESAVYYTKECRGLSEPEKLFMENEYAELSKAAFKKACRDRHLSAAGVTFEQGTELTTITIHPQQARVLIAWGQEYEKLLQKHEQHENN